MEILAYVLGALGILVSFIIYQQKTRKGLLLSKLTGDAVWLFHYLLIGAYTGAAIGVIGVLRELVFVNKPSKKWANSPLWLVLFLSLSALSGVFTWKDWFSIFPCIASAIAVISFWIGKPKLSRILIYPITLFMLIYNVSNLAYLAIANETLSLVSAVIGTLRHDLGLGKKAGSEKEGEPREGERSSPPTEN